MARYVSHTGELTLRYSGGEADAVFYTYADWAGGKYVAVILVVSCLSTPGQLFSCISKLQSVLAASSVEKYIVQARSVREALWIRKIIYDFEMIPNYIDSEVIIKLLFHLKNKSRANATTNHIIIAFHLTRDYGIKGWIILIAEGVTKPLGKYKLSDSNQICGLLDISDESVLSEKAC